MEPKKKTPSLESKGKDSSSANYIYAVIIVLFITSIGVILIAKRVKKEKIHA